MPTVIELGLKTKTIHLNEKIAPGEEKLVNRNISPSGQSIYEFPCHVSVRGFFLFVHLSHTQIGGRGQRICCP